MGDQQNLDSKSSHDRAWTTDEIRKHSSNWTLAGDVGLFNLLNEFSHQIISRTHEVENEVDSLVHQTKMTSANINNVINDFHMLSNLQFVENRVYDEEIQEPASENKPPAEKTKEQREAEMIPRILQAVELGLSVLDTAFDRINVNEISDSEDEDISSEGHTILEPKDPYANRPLPYIIGSEEFMKCEFAGLKDLIEEDALSFSEESSISETDETSSDEGEPLPLDDDKFSDRHNDEMSQNISDKLSSSDESELFGSEKEVNGLDSDNSLEFKSKEKHIQRTEVDAQPSKEKRQNSVSSLQSKLKLPQVLPVPKLQEKKDDDGDLFANEDNSDDESPFRKKTGLFTSDVRFGDEKDDLFGGDLFGKSPSKEVKEVKAEVPKAIAKKLPSPAVQETRKDTLFDNDEDSEDDIFNTLIKTKRPTISKTSNAGSQDSSEKADTSSTPSSAPSTKPSGNAFDFVTGGGNADSLFGDDSDGDDLFSSKKTQGKKFEFDSSENDDLFGIISSKAPAPKESKPIQKKPEKPLARKKTKDSIFEDSDSSDQEKQVPVKSPLSLPVKSKKEVNLFGDDDLDDDIFSQVSQKKPEVKKEKKKLGLFDEESKLVENTETKPVKAVEKSKSLSLFDDTDEILPKETKQPVKAVEKPKTLNLFDAEEELSKVSNVPKTQQNKSSLFDDSDNFDLFTPKPAVTKVEPPAPVKVSKPTVDVSKEKDESKGLIESKVSKQTIDVPKTKDETDGIFSSKISSTTEGENEDNQASFDTPVDSSNVLNVINKGRVRVAAKRRKPTRQGRLAAIENSEKDTVKEVVTPPATLNLSVSDDSDSLFSAPVAKSVKPEPPKLDYKAQEKKKMNLMSQLISEVASSKIVHKRAVEEEDEDDVDIFSEAAKKDRSKSSFSFKPPEENGIASMFPIEKKEENADDCNVPKAEDLEDDFFTEPSFQNFRSSISHKDPPAFDLDDDDDDDDLFSAIKSNILPKTKPDASESNDLFGDETDIFADVQKEKYEMFPNQIYDDDEDDDIFSNLNNTNAVSSKSSGNAVNKTNNSTIKKVETKQVNAFDDPLTGLLGED